MGNYNNNDRKFGRSSRPRFGGGNSSFKQMYDAVCAECGKGCKVPFMPNSGKPVYCSNCFEDRGNGENEPRSYQSHSRSNFSDRRSFTPRNDRPTENYSEQFEIINIKLDKIFNLLNEMNEKAE